MSTNGSRILWRGDACTCKTGSTARETGQATLSMVRSGFWLERKDGLCAKWSEPVYRFLTAACQVQMSVEHFTNSSIQSFRFRDDLTNRAFCLSASREKDQSCLNRFVGSMAIAHYHFRSRGHSGTPFHLRERVLTIDHDSRISPRPPFERALTVERAVVSDIQAFGYDADSGERTASDANPLPVWYLVRQDLYLNEQTAAFLVVHWKHTLNFISLLDVLPGDGTELISE